MTVYIVEILGRSIAAFNATDDVDADTHLRNRAFLRDLIVLQNEGRALWDGVSPIKTRTASEEEVETWRSAKTLKKIQETDDDFHPVVFLIPVVDPSSDRFDDDDDDDRDHDHD
jgi:hypothetical protein